MATRGQNFLLQTNITVSVGVSLPDLKQALKQVKIKMSLSQFAQAQKSEGLTITELLGGVGVFKKMLVYITK